MLFSTTAACHVCHMVTTDEKLVGPSLKGIASRAAERQPGLDANAYLHASILAPNEYIVPGYVAGIMPQSYRQQLTAEQVDDLVSYLLTLE
jgi:mono/diheme cytochrome c family protein